MAFPSVQSRTSVHFGLTRLRLDSIVLSREFPLLTPVASSQSSSTNHMITDYSRLAAHRSSATQRLSSWQMSRNNIQTSSLTSWGGFYLISDPSHGTPEQLPQRLLAPSSPMRKSLTLTEMMARRSKRLMRMWTMSRSSQKTNSHRRMMGYSG